MNDTQANPRNEATAPADPVMAASDPAMFAPFEWDENNILYAHLNSGWHKQSAAYPTLSEPWRETSAVLDDLIDAHNAARAARQAQRESEAAAHTPEAGS
jgi:hypothetical protein